MLEDTDYMVTLDTELEHVKAYTMLEEARFEKRLSIEINADPEALRSCVPNLILQPIVENAVHHGGDAEGKRSRKGHRKRKTGGTVHEDRRDRQRTGNGLPDRPRACTAGKSGTHRNRNDERQQRLISLYGKSYGLQIVTSEEGTDVRMNIPDSAAGSAQQEETIG